MYDNLQVVLGINLTARLCEQTKKGDPKRVSKKALKDALDEHPDWDFRIVRGPFAPPGGTYINREDMRREGVKSLEVYDQRTQQFIATVTFNNGKAVVR